jgi:tetratricopeptide (TPR) repeat protein
MLDEAVFVLVDGIKNHPTYVAARVMLGKIYLQKKQVAEAKNEFEQVIAVNPENILAGKKLAAIYQAEGELQKAFDACKRILLIDPSDKETKGLLSSLEKEVASRPNPEPVQSRDPDTTKTDAIPLPIDENSPSLPGETEPFPVPEAPQSSGESLSLMDPTTPVIPMTPSSEPEGSPGPSLPAEEIKESPDLLPPSVEERLGPAPSEEIDFLREQIGSPFGGPSPDPGNIDEIMVEPLSDMEPPVEPSSEIELPPEPDLNERQNHPSTDEPLAVESASFQLVESSSEAESEELATTTLASLYISQGHFREAVEVYRKILARDPSDKESLRGLEYALQKLTGPIAAPAPENSWGSQPKGKKQLQSWLDSIRKDKEE